MNTGVYLANLDENIGEFRKWIVSVHKLYGSEENWERMMKVSGSSRPKKKAVFDGIEQLAKALETDSDVPSLEKLAIDLVGEIILAADGDMFDSENKGITVEENLKKIATAPYSVIRK